MGENAERREKSDWFKQARNNLPEGVRNTDDPFAYVGAMVEELMRMFTPPPEDDTIASTCVTSDNGDVEWRTADGQLHRMDGPAMMLNHGADKFWYRLDQRHRSDGPAVEMADGTMEYWLKGRKVTKEDVVKPKPEGGIGFHMP